MCGGPEARAEGTFASPQNLGRGNFVRLRDIAEVVLDYGDWEIQSRADSRIGIALLPLMGRDPRYFRPWTLIEVTCV